MRFGSTLSYPHKEFLTPTPHPHQVQPAPAPQQVQPAPVRKAVRIPAPVPQMQEPATRAGKPPCGGLAWASINRNVFLWTF